MYIEIWVCAYFNIKPKMPPNILRLLYIFISRITTSNLMLTLTDMWLTLMYDFYVVLPGWLLVVQQIHKLCHSPVTTCDINTLIYEWNLSKSSGHTGSEYNNLLPICINSNEIICPWPKRVLNYRVQVVKSDGQWKILNSSPTGVAQ